MVVKLAKQLDSLLLAESVAMFRANKAVHARLNSAKHDALKADERLQFSENDLDAELSYSIQRLQRVENKAMGTLFGVAAAISVFGAASGVLTLDGLMAGRQILQAIAGTLILLAMGFLLSSGLLALGAFRIGTIYRPTLQDRVNDDTAEGRKLNLLFSTMQNNDIGTIRTNKLSVSFGLLRNGLILVFMLGVLLIVATVLSSGSAPNGSSTESQLIFEAASVLHVL